MAEGGTRQTDKDDDIIEEEKNCKVTYVFRDLLNERVDFDMPGDETTDIITAIDMLVGMLVTKVSSNVMWLPFSRLVKVGSMAEETSIVSPDEFDYLVVLEQKGMEVTRSCKKNKGYAHIKIIDPQLHLMWRKWLHGDFLKAAFTQGLSHLWQLYFETLGNAFMQEIATVVSNSNDELAWLTQTGIMRVDKNVGKHGPAFTPQFLWEPHSRKRKKITINVDFTMAFEFELSPDIICESDTFRPNFWRKVKAHGKFMLIPCHVPLSCTSCQLSFRLTFTETEVELVRALNRHHKNIYKLLKYIFNSGGGMSYISSYVWKTLVLKHACICRETGNLAACFKTLVASCLHYLFNRTTCEKVEPSRFIRLFMRGEKFELNIPSIFIKDHNILDTKDYIVPCEQFLLAIERMLKSLEEINCSENPNIDQIVIVNSHMTAAASYFNALPLVNQSLDLKHCITCYERYFNEKILGKK